MATNPLDTYAAQDISSATGLDDVLSGDDLTGTDEYEMLLKAARDLQNAYTQDRGARDEAIGMDIDTIARLDRVSRGVAPSPAEALARKAVQQQADQSVGLAATLGGANPGAALRSGMEARAAAPSQSAAELEALRAREMDAARALLAAQTSRGRGTAVAGGVGAGNTYAATAGAPFGALSNERAAGDAREAAIIQAGATGVAGYQKGQQGNGGLPKYESYDPFAEPATPSDIRGKTDVQPSPEMADTFLRSISGAGISPDEAARMMREGPPSAADPRSVENGMRAQTGGAVTGAEADNFLRTLHPQSFKYKAPDGVNKAPGTRMGVMAQDLPAHDVVTDPAGKKWISADVMNDVLAGLGRVNEKVDSVTGSSGRGGRARQRTGAAISEDERRRMSAQQAPQQPQEVMIPQSAVHDYLAGLGIVAP